MKLLVNKGKIVIKEKHTWAQTTTASFGPICSGSGITGGSRGCGDGDGGKRGGVVMSWQMCCHILVQHLPDSDQVSIKSTPQ